MSFNNTRRICKIREKPLYFFKIWMITLQPTQMICDLFYKFNVNYYIERPAP